MPLAEPMGQLMRLVQQEHAGAVAFESRFGLTAPQFYVLSTVVSMPGMDQRTVSARAYVDTSTATAVIRRLVASGLVIVRRDRGDARRGLVDPTQQARDLVYASSSEIQRVNARFLSRLPDPQGEMVLIALTRLAGGQPTRYVVPGPAGQTDLLVDWGPGRLLRASQQRFQRLWAHASGSQASFLQALCLVRIDENRAPMAQGDLLEAVRVDKASLTAMVQRMVRQGVVETRPDPNDGRRRSLFLTPEGESTARESVSVMARLDREFLAPLTSLEAQQLRDSLARLAQITPILDGAPYP